MLVGVSGGADSLTLLHFLHGLGYPLVCATFDHRLRLAAAGEVEHVRQIAENLGIGFVSDSADVAAHAQAEGLSIEEAARSLRYRFLFRAARLAGAQAVAVGHTADDQAETVLMHFLRGSGLSGLKGMAPRSFLPVFDNAPAGDHQIPLVRPLLGWRRADTEAYCREHGLTPIHDPTNSDTTYFRNRLRHTLLPELESYNPQIRAALARTAQALQGDDELLAELVEAAWQQSAQEQGAGYIAFARPTLEGFSPALRRNLFRRAAFLLRPGLRDVDFEALERASTLKPVDLAGGLQLFVEAGKIYLAACEADLPFAAWPQVQAEGLVGWELARDIIATGDFLAQAIENGDPFTAWLDADLTEGDLRVRALRAGDRFQPLGMGGRSVKLQDFFVNIKLPKHARARWPLFCLKDEIVWVGGLRLAHPFRVTEQTRRAVKLTLRKI